MTPLRPVARARKKGVEWRIVATKDIQIIWAVYDSCITQAALSTKDSWENLLKNKNFLSLVIISFLS